MFYILNFGDHSFKSVDFASDVRKYLKKIQGKVAPDNIEIINGWGDETRYSIDEFQHSFPPDETDSGEEEHDATVEEATPKSADCQPEIVSIFVVDGVVSDVFASSSDTLVEIVDFDTDYGDKDQLNDLWDEATDNLHRINCCIDHCENEN